MRKAHFRNSAVNHKQLLGESKASKVIVQDFRTLKQVINYLCSNKRKPTVDVYSMELSNNFFNNKNFLLRAEKILEQGLENNTISSIKKREILKCLNKVIRLIDYYTAVYDEYLDEFDSLIGDETLAHYNPKESYLFNSPVAEAIEIRALGRDKDKQYYKDLIFRYQNMLENT